MSDSDQPESDEAVLWRPLSRNERRVLGVLVEKAKTTPDNYPMTIAALVTGSNQKSNRSPQLQLDEDDVLEALESLRASGAVREIQGSGRVSKYRHCAYEWLRVNSPQAAVMTELLLRGPQTAGELRSRASRMEPFADLESLGKTLSELQAKELVVPLTPPGRGQIFTHALYEPDELRRLQRETGGADMQDAADGEPSSPAAEPLGGSQAARPAAPPSDAMSEHFRRLEAEIEQLRERVERLEEASQGR